MLKVGADRGPGGLAHPRRQQVRHPRERQVMDHRGVDPVEFRFIESGRRTPEMREVEAGRECARIQCRIDRVRCAQPREQRDQCFGLDSRFAQRRYPQRAEPLGQLAFGSGQQRLVRKARRRGTERGEHLDLAGGVGHVILAAQHIGDAHRDIVDHRWQQVQP